MNSARSMRSVVYVFPHSRITGGISAGVAQLIGAAYLLERFRREATAGGDGK
jgi:hypothetical protein